MRRFLCFLLAFGLLSTSLHSEGTEEILHQLACRARESKSDSVLITRNGKVIFEYRADAYWQPIDALSISKSMTALAVSLLIDEGKLTSLDTPVYQFYPEWDQGMKRNITVRHLLSHTSGLQADPTLDEVYNSKNCIQLALCAELSTVPGTAFNYNNKAVNLLAGIVEKASGRSLSQYLALKLFTPMGIENVSWLTDPSGTEYAMAHMIITAPDLVKIGQMLENGGFYCGQQILSKASIQALTTPSHALEPFHGLLWWMDYYNVACWWDAELLQMYEMHGVNPCYVRILRQLNGRVMDMHGRTVTPRGSRFFSNEMVRLLGGPEHADAFVQEVRAKHLPIAKWEVGGLKSFSARGAMGQQLIVFPGQKVVAVRQVRGACDCEEQVDPFHDLGSLVEELIYRMGP